MFSVSKIMSKMQFTISLRKRERERERERDSVRVWVCVYHCNEHKIILTFLCQISEMIIYTCKTFCFHLFFLYIFRLSLSQFIGLFSSYFALLPLFDLQLFFTFLYLICTVLFSVLCILVTSPSANGLLSSYLLLCYTFHLYFPVSSM